MRIRIRRSEKFATKALDFPEYVNPEWDPNCIYIIPGLSDILDLVATFPIQMNIYEYYLFILK